MPDDSSPILTEQKACSETKAAPRAFMLFDALVLIAATASALALYRKMENDHQIRRGWFRIALIVQHGAQTLIPVLTMGSLAFAALRLRQPRPPFRKLARQPGMIASCAAMLTLIIEVLWIILGEIVLPPNALVMRTIPPFLKLSLPDRILHDVRGTAILQANAGGAVAAAWLILALAGLWQAERNWIDRLGRALGIGWIIVNIIMHAALLLVYDTKRPESSALRAGPSRS